MEGFIFTVYKTVTKNKVRKQSETDEYTQSSNNNDTKNKKTNCSYNISDFYPDGYNYHYVATSPVGDFKEQGNSILGQNKRQNTIDNFNYYPSSKNTSTTSEDDDVKALKQTRRSWSHRFFGSCVTGS